MVEIILKYISVFFGSMLKFVLGPLAGMATNLSVIETALFSILGMMTTVLIVIFLGAKTRIWFVKKLGLDKRLNESNKWINRIREGYGLFGIAFLTPLLLSPIVGAVFSVMIGGSRKNILKYMFVSAFFWGITISFLFDRLGTAFFGF